MISFNEAISNSGWTIEEFETAFKSLRRNKAAGIDNSISSTINLDVYEEIENILFSAFKSSLQQGICPNILKIAKVTPLFELDGPENVSNYRPISVFPVFSEILERIIYNRLYKHLKSDHLLFDKQFEFQLNNPMRQTVF